MIDVVYDRAWHAGVAYA